VVQAGQRNPEKDTQTITQLESEWLVARDAATFDHILANDFAHPVPTGDFLTKAQHMDWFTRHQPPENLKFRFDGLRLRLYGALGIANGTVVTSDEHGRDIERTVFTEVFVYRSGHWQAINVQETPVRKPPSR
jgi:hypothetical protein